MSVNSLGSGLTALLCSQLHPSFPYIRKNALIFNRRCACVKYMLPKFYRYMSGFTKKRQEAVGIAVVVPRL